MRWRANPGEPPLGKALLASLSLVQPYSSSTKQSSFPLPLPVAADADCGDKLVCGLQLQQLDGNGEGGGRWVDVPVIGGHELLVVVGDEMEIMSNTTFRAAVHLVVASGEERTLLVVFYQPEPTGRWSRRGSSSTRSGRRGLSPVGVPPSCSPLSCCCSPWFRHWRRPSPPHGGTRRGRLAAPPHPWCSCSSASSPRASFGPNPSCAQKLMT